ARIDRLDGGLALGLGHVLLARVRQPRLHQRRPRPLLRVDATKPEFLEQRGDGEGGLSGHAVIPGVSSLTRTGVLLLSYRAAGRTNVLSRSSRANALPR